MYAKVSLFFNFVHISLGLLICRSYISQSQKLRVIKIRVLQFQVPRGLKIQDTESQYLSCYYSNLLLYFSNYYSILFIYFIIYFIYYSTLVLQSYSTLICYYFSCYYSKYNLFLEFVTLNQKSNPCKSNSEVIKYNLITLFNEGKSAPKDKFI